MGYLSLKNVNKIYPNGFHAFWWKPVVCYAIEINGDTVCQSARYRFLVETGSVWSGL